MLFIFPIQHIGILTAFYNAAITLYKYHYLRNGTSFNEPGLLNNILITLNLLLIKHLILPDNIPTKAIIDLWGKIEGSTRLGAENDKSIRLKTKTKNNKQIKLGMISNDCTFNHQFKI